MLRGIENVPVIRRDQSVPRKQIGGKLANANPEEAPELIPCANKVFIAKAFIKEGCSTTVIEKKLGDNNPTIDDLITKLHSSAVEPEPARALIKVKYTDKQAHSSIGIGAQAFADAVKQIQTNESHITIYYHLSQLPSVHPYIARLIGYNYILGEGYSLFIEPEGTCNLDEFLIDNNLPLRSQLLLLKNITTALEHLHAVGIVHQDLKPANILTSSTLQIKLCDFEQASPADTVNLHAYGTAGYFPPEFHSTKMVVKTAGDIFSLGPTAYRILTNNSLPEALRTGWDVGGNVTFYYKDLIRLGFRALVPPSKIKTSGLANLIRRCWAQDPNKRPEINEIQEIIEQHECYDQTGDAADSVFFPLNSKITNNNTSNLEFDPDFYIYELLNRPLCEDDSDLSSQADKYALMRRELEEKFQKAILLNNHNEPPFNTLHLPFTLPACANAEIKILSDEIQQQIKTLFDDLCSKQFPQAGISNQNLGEFLNNALTDILGNSSENEENHGISESEAIVGIKFLKNYHSKLIVLQAALYSLRYDHPAYLAAALKQEKKFKKQRNGSVVGLFSTVVFGSGTAQLIDKVVDELNKNKAVIKNHNSTSIFSSFGFGNSATSASAKSKSIGEGTISSWLSNFGFTTSAPSAPAPATSASNPLTDNFDDWEFIGRKKDKPARTNRSKRT